MASMRDVKAQASFRQPCNDQSKLTSGSASWFSRIHILHKNTRVQTGPLVKILNQIGPSLSFLRDCPSLSNQSIGISDDALRKYRFAEWPLIAYDTGRTADGGSQVGEVLDNALAIFSARDL